MVSSDTTSSPNAITRNLESGAIIVSGGGVSESMPFSATVYARDVHISTQLYTSSSSQASTATISRMHTKLTKIFILGATGTFI